MKLLTFIPLLFQCALAYAQQCVEVTYETVSFIKQKVVDEMKQKNENLQYSDIVANIASTTHSTFCLHTNGHQSRFSKQKEVEELEENKTKIVVVSKDYVDEESTAYKDFGNRTCSEEIDFLMRTYVINDTLNVLSWSLQNEQKDILGLTCYKATVDSTVVAWYCPQIPINDGPLFYWGLPGLILELQDENASYTCSEIKTLSDSDIDLKKKKGKVMTRQEFCKFRDDTVKILRDRK